MALFNMVAKQASLIGMKTLNNIFIYLLDYK